MSTESQSAGVVAAARAAQADEETSRQLQDAVASGVTGQAARFNTTSNNLAGKLIAEERAIKELLADLDIKRTKLDEEYEDAMLAHSMIASALAAAERGRK